MRSFERLAVGTLSGIARRILALVIVLVVVLPAPQLVLAAVRAHGVQGVSSGKQLTDVSRLVIRDATPVEAERIRRVVAAIRYPLNTKLFSIDVYDQSGPDMADAAAYYEYPASIIHLKRGSFEHRTDGTLGRLVAHEIGHMVDLLYFNDKDRAVWGELRGYPPGMTWDDREATWENRPSEDFAETFAQLTQPLSLEPMATAYGPVTHETTFRRLLARHVSNGGETLQSIQTERALNEISDQVRWATTEPLVMLVLECFVILYALSGALSGFREARLQVLRDRAMRRSREAPATGRAPGTAPREGHLAGR